MAPILGNRDALDAVEEIAIRSAVVVMILKTRSIESQGRKRKRGTEKSGSHYKYKSCAGFIAARSGTFTYIALPENDVNTDQGDVLSVRFSDSTMKEGTVFLSKVGYKHMIVRVIDAPASCSAVTYMTDPSPRDNVFVLVNSGMDTGLSSYSGSMIFPSTKSVSLGALAEYDGPNLDKGQRALKGSNMSFAFSLSGVDSLEDTIGAPVFNLTGTFLGTIWQQDKRSFAIKYAYHSAYIWKTLLNRINAEELRVAAV